MTNMERISQHLSQLGLKVSHVDENTSSPIGVEFNHSEDFDQVLATLRCNGYRVIRYVDIARYVLLMPPAA